MFKILFIIFSFVASSQDIVELKLSETSTAGNPAAAKNEIVQKAMSSAAIQQIVGILGQEQYNAKKDTIKQSILKKTNLFIPFYTTGPIQETGEGYKMDVNLKVSQEALKNLLSTSGVVHNSTGTPTIMPFIALRDNSQRQSFSWWEGGDQSIILSQMGGEVENIMYSSMSPLGFYLARPVTFKMKNKFSQSEFGSILDQMKAWAQTESSQIYLIGEIIFMTDSDKSQSNKARLKFTAYQTSSGKELAEVVRSVSDIQGGFEMGIRPKVKEMIKAASEDLIGLVKDHWQRGTVDSKQVKLAITGELNHKDLTNIKKIIQSNLKEIKDMKEKLVEPGRVTFELDFDGDVAQLGQKIKSLSTQGFSSQLVSQNSSEIVIDIKKL